MQYLLWLILKQFFQITAIKNFPNCVLDCFICKVIPDSHNCVCWHGHGCVGGLQAISEWKMNLVAVIWLDNWQGGYCRVNLTGRTERTAAWLTLERCVYRRPHRWGLGWIHIQVRQGPISMAVSVDKLKHQTFDTAISHLCLIDKPSHKEGMGRELFPTGAGSIYTFPCSPSGKPKKQWLLSHYFTLSNAITCYCWSTFSICLLFRFYLSFSLDRCGSQNTSTAHWDSRQGSVNVPYEIRIIRT